MSSQTNINPRTILLASLIASSLANGQPIVTDPNVGTVDIKAPRTGPLSPWYVPTEVTSRQTDDSFNHEDCDESDDGVEKRHHRPGHTGRDVSSTLDGREADPHHRPGHDGRDLAESTLADREANPHHRPGHQGRHHRPGHDGRGLGSDATDVSTLSEREAMPHHRPGHDGRDVASTIDEREANPHHRPGHQGRHHRPGHDRRHLASASGLSEREAMPHHRPGHDGRDVASDGSSDLASVATSTGQSGI